jgi:hypothetical protein
MKTITKEYKVYPFNELSPEAQEKAMEDWRMGDDLPFLAEGMVYRLKELLKEHKIKSDDARVYYSLSYCQGDGAMFEGTLYWKARRISVKHLGYYYHSNSKTYEIYSAKTDKEASKSTYDEFETTYQDICDELEEYGYNYIESSYSRKTLSKTFEANGYTFLENGKMFNE